MVVLIILNPVINTYIMTENLHFLIGARCPRYGHHWQDAHDNKVNIL